MESTLSGLTVLERIESLRRREDAEEVPGSSFLRWYDETRILEVNGILTAAPHPAPCFPGITDISESFPWSHYKIEGVAKFVR
jgi:hypothetical protein